MNRAGDIGERLAQCRQAAEHGPELTPAERAEFDTLRAREMARAEARRLPSPQLDLEQAA